MPNEYGKDDTEKHLDIFMHISQGMAIGSNKLQELGVASRKNVVLELRKSLYERNRLVACGVSFYTSDLRKPDSSVESATSV